MRPNSPEKYEHEYIRHGTQTLIASMEVVTGKICGHMGDTRGSMDFINFIKKRVATDPEAKWIFIVDNLNTHKSVDLVIWLANEIGFKGDLGKYIPNSNKSFGILKSQETRSRFLSDNAHRIRFVYTPKHCSWMNQIDPYQKLIQGYVLLSPGIPTAPMRQGTAGGWATVLSLLFQF